MRIVTGPTRQPGGATVAQVSYSDRSGFGAVGAWEHRSPPVFGPRGLSWLPCEGDNLLLLPADGVDTCAGVRCSTAGLEAGELRLTSAGGATLVLKNSGDILLNGVTITKSGQILPVEEGGQG